MNTRSKESRRFSFGIKSLSVILSILTVLFTLPLTIIARDISDIVNSNNNVPDRSEGESGVFSSYSLVELEDERDQYTKVIRDSNGKTTVAEYGMPVHIKNAEDKWEDIDNTLSDRGDHFLTGNTGISIAKKIGKDKDVFSLDNGRITVSVPADAEIRNTAGYVVESEKPSEEKTDFEKLTTLEHLTSAVCYANVLPSTDFVYTVNPCGVKLEILLGRKAESYSYSFIIRADGLVLETDETGNILVSDPASGELEYILPAPFAYDSNEQYTESEQCYYTLEDNGEGNYTVTVSVDSEWMDSDERSYPVIIDPTIYHGGYKQGNMRDSIISQNYPNNNYGTKTYLKAGYDSANANTIIYVAPWSLPPLPNGSYITDAQLNLTANGTNNFSSGKLNLVAKKIIHSGYSTIWGETTVCWNTGCTYGDILDYNNLSAPSSGSVVSWNITSAVRDWYNDSSTFQGIAVMQYDTSSTVSRTIQFHASESTTIGSGYRPFFTFSFVSTLGVEDYYSYFSSDAGLAGTGYVNASTGALTLSKSLLSTTDSLFPYAVNLVYNSKLANKTYTYSNAQTAYGTNISPYGFKLNIQETIIKKKYKGPTYNDIYYYIWSDSDGTEHWFKQKSGSTAEYEDEDGLQLTLTTVSSSQITIKDDSGMVKCFSKMTSNPASDVYESWYLSSVRDGYYNTVSFTFDSGYRPLTVKLTPSSDSEITFLNIEYDSTSGLPYAIWNGATKEAIILKYSQTYSGSLSTSGQKYLRQLVYVKGNSGTTVTSSTWYNHYYSGTTTGLTVNATVYYSYDSSGRITSAKDGLSDYEIKYTWSSGKVSAVQEYGGTSAGQKIGISYYDRYTEVRNSGSDDVYGNSDDFKTRYIFDDRARTSSTYSTDVNGTAVYGASSGVYENAEKIKNNIKTATSVGGSYSTHLLNGGFEYLNTNNTAKHWTASGSVSYVDSPFSAGGNHAARFSVSSGTTSSLYQYTKLPEGTYTFSMSVQTMDCENITARVKAVSLNNSAHTFTEEIPVNKCFASGSESPFSFSFSAANCNSTGYESFKILVEVTGESGASSQSWIAVDNLMLEKAVGSSNYNLVQLGNFEPFTINSSGVYSSQLGTYWTPDTGTVVTASAGAPFGTSLKVSSDISSSKFCSQRVYTVPEQVFDAYVDSGDSDQKDKTYIISGFSKGMGQARHTGAAYRLRVVATYYLRGIGEYETNEDRGEYFVYDFITGINDWQFVCGNFKTDTQGLLCYVDVYCEYSKQPSGYALFDNISVVESTNDSVVEYEYYNSSAGVKEGLLRAKTAGHYIESYEYDSNRQLTRIANNRGEIYDYLHNGSTVNEVTDEIYYTFTYGSSGSSHIYPYLASDPDSLITKTPKSRTYYDYTENGQLRSTTKYEARYNTAGTAVVPVTGNPSIRTYNEYDESTGSKIFGALVSQVDSLGRETKYYYDSNSGRLEYSINVPESTGTYYTYDSVGRLSGVYPATYTNSNTPAYNIEEEEVEYSYNTNGRLESIATVTTEYILNYDAFGNKDNVYAGSYRLSKYEYNSNNGKITKVYYGSGTDKYVRYVYDRLENVSEIWYKNGGSEQKAFEYSYTSYGQLARVDNILTGKSTAYKYDTDGKLVAFVEYDTGDFTNEFSSTMFYNDEGKIDLLWYTIDYSYSGGTDDHDFRYFYSYNPDGSLDSYDVTARNVSGSISYSYDVFKRLDGKVYHYGNYTNTVGYTYSTYTSGSLTRTSSQVATYSSRINSGTTVTSTYTYDGNGNITKIHLSTGAEYRYSYDNLGQLTREDNTALNKTFVYSYDNAGNILSKTTYNLTAEGSTPSNSNLLSTNTYTYNDATWGDLLKKFNNVSITYDGIGNPLSYYNGSSYTFTWKNGRQLATAVKGSYTLSFDYNDEGIRTSKTVNGTEHVYHLSGKQIEAEEWDGNLLVYLYDAEGSPIGMQYRNDTTSTGTFYTFWFEKNLQGDVIAVYNSSGTKCLSYVYDAWGNVTPTPHNLADSNENASLNPFRYRGYYYDTDTRFYYLNSRYFDPATGRFINADGQLNAGLLGYNQFAYCENNPKNNSDPMGCRKYYDADEPDWASSFTSSQLEMVLEIGITEFDSYPDEIQDILLFMSLNGCLPPGIKLRDLYSFYCDYSSNNNSFFSSSYASQMAKEYNTYLLISSTTICSISHIGPIYEIISNYSGAVYDYYGCNQMILLKGSIDCIPTVIGVVLGNRRFSDTFIGLLPDINSAIQIGYELLP